jgi:hypothetical protein
LMFLANQLKLSLGKMTFDTKPLYLCNSAFHFNPINFNSVCSMTIEALEFGEPLLLEATRDEFFVFGHHMGKADLKYIIADGDGKFSRKPHELTRP